MSIMRDGMVRERKLEDMKKKLRFLQVKTSLNT